MNYILGSGFAHIADSDVEDAVKETVIGGCPYNMQLHDHKPTLLYVVL